MDSNGITIDAPEREPYSPVCTYCRHYRPEAPGDTCAAFTEEIPLEIWSGRNSHTRPYPGDHGVQFEPLPPSENNISTE